MFWLRKIFLFTFALALVEAQASHRCEEFSVSLEQKSVREDDYIYHLRQAGRYPGTHTYLISHAGLSCCGLEEGDYIDNLSSYREDRQSNGNDTLAFDLERTVLIHRQQVEYSMMLTASYQPSLGEEGPTREDFIRAASALPGFHLERNEMRRVRYRHAEKNIFVNWLEIEGKVTIGAIQSQGSAGLEDVIANTMPAAVESFRALWPERVPRPEIIQRSIDAARVSDQIIPEELKP